MKNLIVLLFFPVFAHAQTINLGGGIHNKKTMFQIEAGVGNKFTINASYQAIPVREAKTVNFYYGLKAGYNIENFVPQIGYFFSHNGFKGLAYFLKYEIEINDKGGIYIEAGYLEHTQLNGGFKIKL